MGKMDLVEAEALADLIAAETEAQRRFALAGAGGVQSELYAGWRKRILHARAMIEAELDFADEGDVPGSVSAAVWDDMRLLVTEIEAHLAGFRQAEIIREGYSVVIAGAPNAGKSSLLNALARRDVAIVTDEPGTTRDLVHVALDLNGLKVVVTDTAGIREDAGKVEAIGIARALASVQAADLVLLLEDVTSPGVLPAATTDAPVLKVASKVDLMGDAHRLTDGRHDIEVSAKSGAGVNDLLTMISRRAAAATDTAWRDHSGPDQACGAPERCGAQPRGGRRPSGGWAGTAGRRTAAGRRFVWTHCWRDRCRRMCLARSFRNSASASDSRETPHRRCDG